MKKKVLLYSFLILLCLIPIVGNAQTITLNQGRFIREGGQVLDARADGTFKFLNGNSEVTGKLDEFGGGAILTFCPADGCAVGQTIRILDYFTGRNKLRQDPTVPVIVNGISYPTIYYRGEPKFDGGTVRIPYYFAKRKNFKLTIPAKLTGFLSGYPTLSEDNPIFTTTLNLTGTVTVTFTRQDANSSAPRYKVASVIYDFPPTNTAN